MTGGLLLAVSVFFLSETLILKATPETWAGLFPVLSAVLLIAAGKDGWFNKRILSRRILVWFGLISYPLYLWHWPLLSMARIVLRDEPPWWWRYRGISGQCASGLADDETDRESASLSSANTAISRRFAFLRSCCVLASPVS